MEESRRFLQESFNQFVSDWKKTNPYVNQNQKRKKQEKEKSKKRNSDWSSQKKKEKPKAKNDRKKSLVSKNKKIKKKKELFLITPGLLHNQHGLTKNNLYIYRMLSDGDNCHNIGATTALVESLLQTVINLKCKQFGILLIVDVYEKPPLFKSCFTNLNKGQQNLDGTPMVHFLPAIVCDFLILVYPYGKYPSLNDWEEKKVPSGKAYPYRAIERKTFTDFLSNQNKRVKLQRKKIASMQPYMLPRRAGFLFEVNSLKGCGNAWTRIAGAKANATERDKLCVDETFSVVDTCCFLLKLILKCQEYGGSDLSLLVKKVPKAFPSWWNILSQHRKKYANRDNFYSEKICFDKKENAGESWESETKSPCQNQEEEKGNKKFIDEEEALQLQRAIQEAQEAESQEKPDNSNTDNTQNEEKEKKKTRQTKKSDQPCFIFPTMFPLFEEFDTPQDVPQPKLSISDQNSPENIWFKQIFSVGQGIGAQGALAIMNCFKYGFPAIEEYKNKFGEEALIQKIGGLCRLENLKTFGIEKKSDQHQEQFKKGRKIGVETARRFVRSYYSVRYNANSEEN